MSDKKISKREAKKYLKDKYNIPDVLIKAMDYFDYDFEENHKKYFAYTTILEWLCKRLIKFNNMEIIDNKYDRLNACWRLNILIDITRIYDSDSGRIVRNRALKKFIESLGLYEWIIISLENKKMVVDDDAICWGFEGEDEDVKGLGIMTIEKDKNGNYIYKFYDR